ncbi:NAD-dependent epimerase/dehydratase family protein, partial [Dermatophilus congolensis]
MNTTPTQRRLKAVVTGANGFLGWHLRARLLTLPNIDTYPINRADFATHALEEALSDADLVFHCAGINRSNEHELNNGNIALANRLVTALESTVSGRYTAGKREPAVVYAGSNHACPEHPNSSTPYGHGKRQAGHIITEWAEHAGGEASATDLRFCGLFGEHGRPDYNSFVATFAHTIAHDGSPRITDDREIPLLHVGEACERMIAAALQRTNGIREQTGTMIRISEVARTLERFHSVYAPTGEIPDLNSPLGIPLFNTLRAAMWPHAYPIPTHPNTDERGTLIETIRVHGSSGQVFHSTTNPGYTRGNHFHLNKIERFQVLHGTARICLRRVLTNERIDFDVTGDNPVTIDMPTLWTHNITNTGTTPLHTMFWTNELYDP